MTARERLLRIKMNCKREAEVRRGNFSDVSPEHQDRYKLGFVEALEWVMKLCDSEVEAELEEEAEENNV